MLKKLSSEQIASQLEACLPAGALPLSFDIASVLTTPNLIRHRIESGERKGPRILTVGDPFWIKTARLREGLSSNPTTSPIPRSITTQAAERVRQQLHGGADGIKIFANSVEADGILKHALGT